VRVRLWTFPLLLILLLAGLPAFSCGGSNGGNGQVNLNDVPTATLPSTLPDPLIVSGTPRPAAGGTYTVASGDNPSSIAAQFGISVDELMAANGITDPTLLHAGQKLIIPGAQQVLSDTATPRSTAAAATPRPTTTAATPTARPTASQGGGGTYTVREGDIPETIAAQFGISADELMAANGITDPTSLQIGQKLIIPTHQPTATPAQ
jgi:LysM repeat protein